MKKLNVRISQKITGGFVLLIAVFILNAVLSLITLHNSSSLIQSISEDADPSLTALREFNLLVSNSRMYATNWIYLQANQEDKDALKKLHTVDYPALKEHLTTLQASWNPKQQRILKDSIFPTFDTVLVTEKDIMTELASFEDYDKESGFVKMNNGTRLESEVLPLTKEVLGHLQGLINEKQAEKLIANTTMLDSFSNVKRVTLIAGLVLVLIGVAAAALLTRSITEPIKHIRGVIVQLSRGELPENRKLAESADEIGEMAQAVDKLVAGLRSTSLFAEGIGKGNYEIEHEPLSEQDVLGNALIDMRNNLKRVSEEDSRRNWATEGMARFGEILRKNNDNLLQLCDDIISNLVKYTKANQGGLFIINDESGDPFLELKACYAWDKKKYLEQKIYPGEGLTGQSWQEGELIYMTDVPDHYVQITSGLGEANPRSILIVPLKVNEQIYGIVEMASFYAFAPYQVEFVVKVAESIASTVAAAKVNERTQRLLEESQMLTEQMRAQEEEMRQNMEELQATQEEMQRAQRDTEAREKILDETQCIIEFDRNRTILHVNSLAADCLGYSTYELTGKSLETVFDAGAKTNQMRTALAEEQTWRAVATLRTKTGATLTVKAVAGSLIDHKGTVSKHVLILDDITEWQQK
jgi:PAS domain S-box-containing protein